MWIACGWLHCVLVAAAIGAEQPDLSIAMPQGARELRHVLHAEEGGVRRCRIVGLSHGGSVTAKLDGNPVSCELLSRDETGPASEAVLRLDLAPGSHVLHVREEAGVQFFRVEGTACYLATGTAYGARPVFRLDLDARHEEYPIEIRYGPGFKPFFWLSGKWDQYPDRSYTQDVKDITTTSGTKFARFSFTYLHPPKNLVMPMVFELQADPATRNVVLRVKQSLRAVGPCTWDDTENLQFIHVDLNRKNCRDWEDGVPDYFWNREQIDIDPDTLLGLRTHITPVKNNSRRVFPFQPDLQEPKRITMTSPQHTGFGHPLYAENTVGGWLTKTGVGSIGWIMHRYRSSFAQGISPVHSHCGAGADTHIYSGWGKLFFPWTLGDGDWLDVEYTIQCLPSELLREDVEKINELDLLFFGEEKDAKSTIVRWYGTKEACGLIRSDGSALILGLGRERSMFPLPAESRRNARIVFHSNEQSPLNCVEDPVPNGEAIVRPGWVTVIDCGSALKGPQNRALLQPKRGGHMLVESLFRGSGGVGRLLGLLAIPVIWRAARKRRQRLGGSAG